jgi:hypothetical protein
MKTFASWHNSREPSIAYVVSGRTVYNVPDVYFDAVAWIVLKYLWV